MWWTYCDLWGSSTTFLIITIIRRYCSISQHGLSPPLLETLGSFTSSLPHALCAAALVTTHDGNMVTEFTTDNPCSDSSGSFISCSSGCKLTLLPAKLFPRINSTPWSSSVGLTPMVTNPVTRLCLRNTLCTETLTTPSSAPCTNTLAPAEDWSVKGKTSCTIRDWVAPISLNTIIGTVFPFLLNETSPSDRNGR